MTRSKFLVVLLCCLCIVMGLKPRGQAHELISGKMGSTMSHDLKQEGQQHKLAYQQQLHTDSYSQQTTPGDESTSDYNNNVNYHRPSSLLTTQKNQQHKLFGSDSQSSTTHDGKGNHEHEMRSQMSSYEHYYGRNGHKMIKNRQHLAMQQGQGGLRDQYSMMGRDNYDDNGDNNNYYNHKAKKHMSHLQNDYDQPNNGQRTYYVDENALRQGLREQDTSSVKVRDYVDYNKQLTGTPVVRPDTGSSVIIRHNLGDIDTGSSGSSASNHDKVFYQQHKLNDMQGHDAKMTAQQTQPQQQHQQKTIEQHKTRQEDTTSSSVQLHDPNDDQYIFKHMVGQQQVPQQQQQGGMSGNTGVTGVNGMNNGDNNDDDNYDNDNNDQYHKTATTFTPPPNYPQTQTTMTSTGNPTPRDRPLPPGSTSPSTMTTTSTTNTNDYNNNNNDYDDDNNDQSHQHKWRNSQVM